MHQPLCLPMAFRTKDGNKRVLGNVTTPCVQQSTLPGLMGLEALRKTRAVLDFSKMELHFLGPAEYELGHCLPPGTDTFDLEVAPSGHLVLPCSEFKHVADLKKTDYALTLINLNEADLHTNPVTAISMPPVHPPPGFSTAASSSQ